MKQTKLNIFRLFLLLLPIQVVSQISITGTVSENVSNHPVVNATIYVNGTSNGTITNTSGQFSIDKVIPPCEIVVSHISYSTTVIVLKQNSDTVLQIKLNPRDVEVGVVDIIDKNRRKENLQHFKEQFLGTDYWGKHANFENESVLLFSHLKVSVDDSSLIGTQVISAPDSDLYWFMVETREPLIVNLPLLGYKVHVNLINYKELRRNNSERYRIHILGYFYFLPSETSSKKTNRFLKKRTEAYYNSPNHFCSSLFNNQLKENGYIVYVNHLNKDTGLYESDDIEFDNHIVYNNNEAMIIGLKNKRFEIEYYQIFNAPMNLKEREGGRSKFSNVSFLKDTCTIRADGSRPDNSIMFGPEIGNKRVGAMLPYDFTPENIKR